MTYLEKVDSLIASLEKHPVIPASMQCMTLARLKKTRAHIASDRILATTIYREVEK